MSQEDTETIKAHHTSQHRIRHQPTESPQTQTRTQPWLNFSKQARLKITQTASPNTPSWASTRNTSQLHQLLAGSPTHTMSLPKPRQRYPPFTFLNVYIHRKSTIYLACVRSTPSHFLNSHSAVVTDHLCEVTLSWALSHGVFIPSCIFSKQQHRIIHFLINGPPPAIYRKQISLVRDNLILLSQSHAINTTLRKHKYKNKSFKEQPPPTPQSAV